MKVVQTFWSKPLTDNFDAGLRGKRGGWTETKYYFMSWAYSFYLLSKFYDDIELVTDTLGYKLLVQQLELPYSNVHLALDEIDEYPSYLWALGKLYSYSMQKEPFLHVDGDVYIWEKFPPELEQSPLVAQHREFAYPFYVALYDKYGGYFKQIPPFMIDYKNENGTVDAFNLGVTGGRETDFFNEYASEAFQFIKRNLDIFERIPSSELNCFIEQAFFCAWAFHKGIEVSCLLPDADEDSITMLTQEIGSFSTAPLTTNFIHLYGYCKKQECYGKVLEEKLSREFPEEFLRRQQKFPSLL